MHTSGYSIGYKRVARLMKSANLSTGSVKRSVKPRWRCAGGISLEMSQPTSDRQNLLENVWVLAANSVVVDGHGDDKTLVWRSADGRYLPTFRISTDSVSQGVYLLLLLMDVSHCGNSH